MTRNLDNIRNTMLKVYHNDGMTTEEAILATDKYLETNKDNIHYCVTIPDCKLMDMMDNVMIKSPAKYFKNLNHAKIYQLRGILEINIHSDLARKEMIEELEYLENQYPEYSI